MKITCVRHVPELDEFVELDPEKDVYYVDKQKNALVYHTRLGQFLQIVTLDIEEKRLGGFGFKRLDRYSLINISLIKEIDAGRMLVIFDNDVNVSISEAGLKKAWDIPNLKKCFKPISQKSSLFGHDE